MKLFRVAPNKVGARHRKSEPFRARLCFCRSLFSPAFMRPPGPPGAAESCAALSAGPRALPGKFCFEALFIPGHPRGASRRRAWRLPKSVRRVLRVESRPSKFYRRRAQARGGRSAWARGPATLATRGRVGRGNRLLYYVPEVEFRRRIDAWINISGWDGADLDRGDFESARGE